MNDNWIDGKSNAAPARPALTIAAVGCRDRHTDDTQTHVAAGAGRSRAAL